MFPCIVPAERCAVGARCGRGLWLGSGDGPAGTTLHSGGGNRYQPSPAGGGGEIQHRAKYPVQVDKVLLGP